jgi:hypothetical protein
MTLRHEIVRFPLARPGSMRTTVGLLALGILLVLFLPFPYKLTIAYLVVHRLASIVVFGGYVEFWSEHVAIAAGYRAKVRYSDVADWRVSDAGKTSDAPWVKITTKRVIWWFTPLFWPLPLPGALPFRFVSVRVPREVIEDLRRELDRRVSAE